MTPVLSTSDLRVGYGGIAIVAGLNLRVEPGQVVALLGRNGSGKTTTLRTLAGLLPPIAGTISLPGSIGLGPLHKRSRAGLGLVTEERTILRRLTVDENLRLGRGPAEVAFRHFPELVALQRRKAGLLSGGEQQMLALGRALASVPKLLLIDEMSLGLAPQVVRRLLRAVREAALNEGAAVLLIEQHAKLALMNSDYGYVLGRGGVLIEGAATDLLNRLDEVEQSYLAAGSQH